VRRQVTVEITPSVIELLDHFNSLGTLDRFVLFHNLADMIVNEDGEDGLRKMIECMSNGSSLHRLEGKAQSVRDFVTMIERVTNEADPKAQATSTD